ncbi:hypothetical protein [Pseudonocardia sp. GCM10023141]|uniref:hypothetical protein n=1 Tax=Pseudonocardia sp. GCM10023141 TaxID=3252653 RepID=UPI00360CFED9
MSESDDVLRTASGQEIEMHPLLAELATEGPPAVQVFSGYFGPSARGGTVTLYRSLRNLDATIDIAAADILHVADIPESILPFGAKMVWVAAAAEIAVRQTVTGRPARAFDDPDLAETRVGRLRIRKARPMAGAAAECVCISYCSSYCFSVCKAPCTSECHCTSNCRVVSS